MSSNVKHTFQEHVKGSAFMKSAVITKHCSDVEYEMENVLVFDLLKVSVT
jgi:hypothetical protein